MYTGGNVPTQIKLLKLLSLFAPSCAQQEWEHERQIRWACPQGRSQDFSKGGLKLWKQKLWKGKIACDKNSQESTYIVDKQLTVLTTKPGVPILNCHLVSLIFFHDDRTTQPPWLHVSAEFCFDLWFFSTVGKHISHVHVFFIFAKFKKRIKLLCTKLVVLTCLMRL